MGEKVKSDTNKKRKRPVDEPDPIDQPPAKRICTSPTLLQLDNPETNARTRKASDSIDNESSNFPRKTQKHEYSAPRFLAQHEVKYFVAPATQDDNQPSESSQINIDNEVQDGAALLKEALENEESKKIAHDSSSADFYNEREAQGLAASASSASTITHIDTANSSDDSDCGSLVQGVDSSVHKWDLKNLKGELGPGSSSSKTTPYLSPVRNSSKQPTQSTEDSSWRPRGLSNQRLACYQNSILQCLHALDLIRAQIQALGSEPTQRSQDNNPKGQNPEHCAWPHPRKRKRHKVNWYRKCLKDQLQLSCHVARTFSEMSNNATQPVNNNLLQQVCGRTLNTHMLNESNYFDGESQEDAADFLRQLLARMTSEAGTYGSVAQLLENTIVARRRCNTCGTEKTFTESEPVHQAVYNKKSLHCLADLVASLSLPAHEDARFEQIKCDMCGSVGKYENIEGWQRNRVVNPNQYLAVNIARESNEPVKSTLGSFSLPAESNGRYFDVLYQLRAVTVLKRNRKSGGHYTALRRHGEKWFLCDDEEIRMLISEQEVLKYLKLGRVFFFEKASG